MTQQLSPAAQAVWDAAWANTPVQCGDTEGTCRAQVVAALRAAADRVVPEYETTPGGSKIWLSEMKTLEEYISDSSEKISEELESLISDDNIGVEGAFKALVSGIDAWITYHEQQASKWRELKQKLKNL